MTNILQKLAKNHLSLSLLMFNSPLLWVGWLSGGPDITMSARVDGCYHMRLPYLVWYSDLRQRRIIFISCLKYVV